jgi:hypothetical protein
MSATKEQMVARHGDQEKEGIEKERSGEDEDDLPYEQQEYEDEQGQKEESERRKRGFGKSLTFSGKKYLEFEVEATKTDGKLRLDICEDVADEDDDSEEEERKGLFVQNFLRPCIVEDEGLVFIGDELISINKHTVDGFTIDGLVEVLKVADHPQNPTVLLGIRRRRNQQTYQSLSYDKSARAMTAAAAADVTNSGNGSADEIDFDDPQVFPLPLPLHLIDAIL